MMPTADVEKTTVLLTVLVRCKIFRMKILVATSESLAPGTAPFKLEDRADSDPPELLFLSNHYNDSAD